ncbi:MAG: hypothetical protein OXH09_15750 [Gammaproteobacteria bacterium]|nr:hypothetical protein [Gammaproteobacteria bacterium]
MKKQLLALVAVLALGGFAGAGADATGNVEPRSNVVHWATVVFCESYEDGRMVDEVCVGGHTGFVVREFVDVTLSALPGSRATTFLVQ